MNSTWNLDPIYTGFDDPAFASDLEALKKTVSDMTDLTAALDTAEPTEGLRRCVALWEQSEKLVGKLANYASTHDIGKLGIERYYEDVLHGQTGYEEVEVNNRGRVIRQLKEVPPQAGRDIYLPHPRPQAAAVY